MEAFRDFPVESKWWVRYIGFILSNEFEDHNSSRWRDGTRLPDPAPALNDEEKPRGYEPGTFFVFINFFSFYLGLTESSRASPFSHYQSFQVFKKISLNVSSKRSPHSTSTRVPPVSCVYVSV